ncbi:MAG TPA: TolC family protein, partial [Nitrospira sp.]|nr:TolC family protein [Nitrospira sp.]
MTRVTILLCAPVLLCSLAGISAAQTSDPVVQEHLPSAPEPQTEQKSGSFAKPSGVQIALAAGAQGQDQSQMGNPTPGQKIQPPASGTMRLTRTQAEQIALKNNPRISVGRLLALAEHQVYRETRSQELPTFTGDITASTANEGSRIGAGGLNAPRLLEHAGAGVTLSQLLTDFGRTVNLVSSSKLREKAQQANALATTEDIVLATDQAFYNALEAQALLQVAQQTVTTRGSVEHQVDE